MKRIGLITILLTLLATGCRDRYHYIDIGASEQARALLADGFVAADTLPGGRAAWLDAQGEAVADMLVYSDRGERPDAPYGYLADTVGTRPLLESIQTRRGRLFDRNGRNYLILWLLEDEIELPALQRIAQFAEEGVFIGGNRPLRPRDPADSSVFRETVERVWRNGNVMAGTTPHSVFRASGFLPDMKTRTPGLAFTHRRLNGMDIYHVTAPYGPVNGRVRLKFRVTGRQPELWDPATGEFHPVSYKIKGRRTRVTFRKGLSDEYIVFARRADRRKMKVKDR